MVSEKRLAANRRNALRSTGPRTSEGKARSRLNAIKHGLSASIPALVESGRFAGLARALGADDPDPAVAAAAARLAAAEAMLERCRAKRAAIAVPVSTSDDPSTLNALAEAARAMAALDRYERRARRLVEEARGALEAALQTLD